MAISRIMSWSMRRSNRQSSLSRTVAIRGTEDATLDLEFSLTIYAVNRGDGLDGRTVALTLSSAASSCAFSTP